MASAKKKKSTWAKKKAALKKKKRALAVKAYPAFRKLPVRKKKIFFESFSNRRFNDNPKAIYDELCRRHAPYKMIWALADASIDVGPQGKAVEHKSFGYWYHLATSKYIVSNFNQMSSVKRKGQVFVQTMHGTPLKHMGLSVTKTDWKIKRMKQMFSHDWDYFVTPSDYFCDILTGPSYRFGGTFLKVGYPRNDYLVNNKDNLALINEVRFKLDIPAGKKVILYAPTWRTKKSFDLKLDLKRLEEALSDEYVLVIRAHYLEEKYLDKSIYNDFVINGHGYKDVNEMLIAADVLITDYSSIMFDYTILMKPMILFTWDYERYVENTRGTYFDLKSEYPKLLAMTNDDVLDRFESLDEVMEDIEAFHARFNQYETGHAAQSVVDAVFE